MNHLPSPADTAPHPAVAPLADYPLTWRLETVARALGVSRRAIERERAAGRFPRPDLHVGRMPLWKPETVRAWVETGGGR